MKIFKHIWKWINATRLRQLLSATLAVLILLTSIRYIFLKPKDVFADSTLGFDEGYGTTVTDGNNTLSGTITNAVWRSEEFCKVGKCLYFDGTGDLINFGNDSDVNFTTGSFTITGWFRTPDISSGQRTIAAKHNGTAGGYKVYIDSNGYVIFGIDPDLTWSPSDSVSTSTTAFDDNKWHHFAAVKNGTTSISLYVDNILYQTDSAITAGSLTNSDTFYIGIDGNGSSNGFSGFLDEIKVYSSTARSASEIKADFTGETTSRGTSASFGPDNSYLTDGLVGYWTMDETATNSCSGGISDTCDKSGNGFDLYWTNNTTTGTGKYGNSTTYDGTDDYANCDDANCGGIGKLDFDNDDSFTYSTWFNVSNVAGNQFLIGTKGRNLTTEPGYMATVNGTAGDVSCLVGDNSYQQYETSTTTGYEDQNWHLLTCVYDGQTQTIRLYVDGVRNDDGINTFTGSYGNLSFNSTYGFTTGIHRQNLAADLSGKLDEVRVYNRAFSPAEVQKLYNWAPGPVAYFPLDENTGTSTTYDKSTNGNNGTMQGSMTQDDWLPGKFGSGLDLDGSNDNINAGSPTITDNLATNAFTAMAWVKFKALPTANDESDNLLSKSQNTDFKWHYGVRRDNTYIQWNATIDNVAYARSSSAQNVSTGVWYHTAMVYDNNAASRVIKFYVNGTEIIYGSQTAMTGTVGGDSTYDFVIGSLSNNVDYANALVDDVKIYNYARSASQVIEDMNGNHPSPGSPIGSAQSYWKFDEGFGDTANNGGLGGSTYNGNLAGSGTTCPTAASACPTWSNSGKFAKALDFDGTNDFIDAGDQDFTSGITISAWIYWDAATCCDGIVAKRNDTEASGHWSFNLDGAGTNKLEFAVYSADNTSLSRRSTNTIPTATWTHVVVTFDNVTDTANFYINGKKETTAGDTMTNNIANTSESIYIGKARSGGEYFDGKIDEVKIYNFTLNDEQVLVEYNRGSSAVMGATSTDSSGAATFSNENEYCPPRTSGACTPPVAEWKLDENTGTTVNDTGNKGSDDVGAFYESTSANTSGPVWSSGYKGQGVYFPGTDDMIRIPETSETDLGQTTDSYTVSAWFKTTSTAVKQQTIVGKLRSSNGATPFRIYIGSSPKILNILLTDGTNTVGGQSLFDVNDGKWHHTALVRDKTADVMYLYLDGIRVDSDSTTTVTGSMQNNDDISIGNSRADLGTDYINDDFEGYIDNVRIYNYARTQEQVAWEMNIGEPSGWWKLDDNVSGNGQTIGDSTTIDNNGTTDDGANNTGMDCTVEAVRNKGCDFDGTDDFITMGDVAEFDAIISEGRDFSVSGWFNRDTFTTDDAIVGKRVTMSTGNPGFVVWIDDATDKLTFEACDASGASCDEYMMESTSTFTSTGWHHFMVVWDDDSETNTKIYIDGLEETVTRTCLTGGGPTTCTFSNMGTLETVRNFAIGAQHVGTNLFDGKIDDIMLFSYALNHTQVKQIYSNQGASIRFGPVTGSP